MNVSDIRLVQTCFACPEQYEAVDVTTGKTIGYLRLRHGMFTVEVPDAWGELVYEAYPDGDGIFEDTERDYYLRCAREAIAAAY